MPTMYLAKRHRVFVAPEDCRTVAMALGAGIRPSHSDFTTECAAAEFFNSSLWEGAHWSPRIHDLLSKDALAQATLADISDSSRGMVVEYTTIADLSTHDQGEFVTLTGSNGISPATGGFLVSSPDAPYAYDAHNENFLSVYSCCGNETRSSRDLLYPLTDIFDCPWDITAIPWDVLFNKSNPRIKTLEDTDIFPTLGLFNPNVKQYPAHHPVWKMEVRPWGEDIQFDLTAVYIQGAAATVQTVD